MIGNNCIIGAGTLITEGTIIPDNSLVVGSPGVVKRQVTEDELLKIQANAIYYCEEAQRVLSEEP